MYNKIEESCFRAILDHDQFSCPTFEEDVEEKSKIMKPEAISREILLMTSTSFAKRQLYERKDTKEHQGKHSPADELEKACWSGLVFEMLPGLFNSDERKCLFVWKVNQAEQFLHVQLAGTPGSTDYETSIDPYFFLPTVAWYN
jgi:hypothetical protein